MSEPEPPAAEYTPDMIARMNVIVRDMVPHNKALNLEIERLSHGGEVWMKLPWAEHLVGNPLNGALHGGAISSAMDAAGGMAVMAKLGKPSSIATLDLRIDYMKAALRGEDVKIHARCTKVTRHVCFVHATAYTQSESDPVATVAATFARKS